MLHYAAFTKKVAGVFATLSLVASMSLGGGHWPSQSSEHGTLAGKLRKVDFKNTHLGWLLAARALTMHVS